MTERREKSPHNLERLSFPEGFEMPTESVLRAEAVRDVYENGFLYSIVKKSSMPDILTTSEEKESVISVRLIKVRDMLIFGEYDVHGVADEIDMKTLAEKMPIDVYVDSEKKRSEIC